MTTEILGQRLQDIRKDHDKSQKDIAEILCIELSTINVHRKHILKKLGYTSLESLVAFLKRIKLYEEFNL